MQNIFVQFDSLSSGFGEKHFQQMNIFELQRKDTEELPPHLSAFVYRERGWEMKVLSVAVCLSFHHHPSALSFPLSHNKKWYLGSGSSLYIRTAREEHLNLLMALLQTSSPFYPIWNNKTQTASLESFLELLLGK